MWKKIVCSVFVRSALLTVIILYLEKLLLKNDTNVLAPYFLDFFSVFFVIIYLSFMLGDIVGGITENYLDKCAMEKGIRGLNLPVGEEVTTTLCVNVSVLNGKILGKPSDLREYYYPSKEGSLVVGGEVLYLSDKKSPPNVEEE